MPQEPVPAAYRIFIVEDDPTIAESVAEQARLWAMDARCAKGFPQRDGGVRRLQPAPCRARHFAAVLQRLPLVHGDPPRLPRAILFLSSASDNMNSVMAMNMGGDDFIAKPFDRNVLMAKLQALLRRAYDFGAAMPVLEHRGAILDTADNSLSCNGSRVELSKNEYRILLALMEAKGKVVSREKLMERLWETDSFIDDNTLTVNVNRLRKKLDAAGLPDFIATRFGVGYLIP